MLPVLRTRPLKYVSESDLEENAVEKKTRIGSGSKGPHNTNPTCSYFRANFSHGCSMKFFLPCIHIFLSVLSAHICVCMYFFLHMDLMSCNHVT